MAQDNPLMESGLDSLSMAPLLTGEPVRARSRLGPGPRKRSSSFVDTNFLPIAFFVPRRLLDEVDPSPAEP